jgi:hypothetical protein
LSQPLGGGNYCTGDGKTKTHFDSGTSIPWQFSSIHTKVVRLLTESLLAQCP